RRKRREQARADLGQLDISVELSRHEVRKMLRNVQPAVGRDASRDRLSQEDAVFGVSSTDVVLHADDRYGLSIYDARAFGIQRGNPGVAFESMSLESRDHCVANTSCVLVF